MKDDGFSHPLDVLADGHLDRLAELQGRKGLPLIKACAKWMATRPPFNGATDSASVCLRCHGTGAIDAATSADDPSCPGCDGEGVRQ